VSSDQGKERLGIRDLVGRAMIDREFLSNLVRDPQVVLAEFELSAEERAAIMRAVRGSASGSDHERASALQIVLMKRWAT